MAKRKSKSPIEGRWEIVSMTEWDMEYIEEELQPFIEFERSGTGVFQFGYVYGEMDCQLTQRDGKPAVEFSWEGNDEEDHVFGRGWAMVEGDELAGMIFFHQGDESGFVAKRVKEKPKRK
jgi:hypothetical protein